MTKYLLPWVFLACGGATWAQGCLQSSEAFQSWVDKGEPYSVADCRGSSPQQLFREAYAELLQATKTNRRDSSDQLGHLAKAAKAALEAGLNQKAMSYAQQAFTLAQRDRCINPPGGLPERGWQSREEFPHSETSDDQADRDFCTLAFQNRSGTPAEGDAIAASNLILGRLALLNGDVKQAEMFLIQSGQIKAAANSSIFGPNMILALELLKRQRSQAVLQFLDEWSSICQETSRVKLRRWEADIRQGTIPKFGANLLL